MEDWSYLLYTINFLVSLSTKNYLWKLLNLLLIITSSSCDIGGDIGDFFLLLDYICIFFISLCFLNHLYLNTMFIIAMFLEYFICNSIIVIKNVAFVTAALIHSLTIDGFKTFTGCLTIMSLSVYVIRYYYPSIYLTFLWRFCTMLIMVTASYNLDHGILNWDGSSSLIHRLLVFFDFEYCICICVFQICFVSAANFKLFVKGKGNILHNVL